jgi:hypothetical protein
MVSYGMLRPVALVRTDVSEELATDARCDLFAASSVATYSECCS